MIANGEMQQMVMAAYEIAMNCLVLTFVITMKPFWETKIINFIDSEPRLTRPANYPPGTQERIYYMSLKDVQ